MRQSGFISIILFLVIMILISGGIVGGALILKNGQSKKNEIKTEVIPILTKTPVSPTIAPTNTTTTAISSASSAVKNPPSELTWELDRTFVRPVDLFLSGSNYVTAKPEASADLSYKVINRGTEAAEGEITTFGNPVTWFNTSQIPGSVKLNPGEEALFKIGLNIPQNAKKGDTQILHIYLKPKAAPNMADAIDLELVINP